MSDYRDPSTKFESLRQQAEILIKDRSEPTSAEPTDILALINELNIQQIELELQNEKLRRTQLVLAAQAHEFESLYELAPGGYFTLNPKGIITRVNLTGITLLGDHRKRIIGTGLSQYIADSHTAAFHNAREQSAITGEKQSLDLPLESESEDPLWVRTDIDAARNDASELLHWRILMMDITDRVRSEAALREQKNLFEIVLRTTPDFLVLKDSEFANILGVDVADPGAKLRLGRKADRQ
jgi:PAS domain S-box-containing protein